MRVTKQARRTAKELFRACQIDGLLAETRVRQVVSRILETKPRGYLAILNYFQRLLKLDIERRTARIESATPMPADARTQVDASLKRLYGDGLTIRHAVNPAILGGLRVRVGSDIFDGSIQGRLERLKEAF
jgi:F-type H+-transporting ATPase subunit delta